MYLFHTKINGLKVFNWLFFFVLSAFFYSSCEEENARPQSYPRVSAMQVSDISEMGAVFNSEVISLGSESIVQHGFVWGLVPNPLLKYNNKILLGTCDKTGIYRAEILTALTKDVDYTVRPFLQTSEHTVYGPAVKFRSLGSSAPLVTGFEPYSAGWLDTIKIVGKNFSWVPGENVVRLGSANCDVLTSTDTTLTAKVSPDINTIKSVLSVELAGNATIFTQDTFRLIPPVLRDFLPKQARWGDTLYIKGKGLTVILNKPTNFIKLGTFICTRVGEISDSSLAIKIPNEITSLTSNLSLSINGIILNGSQPFELLPPPAFKISPGEGTWGGLITLTGRFHPLLSRNSVFFNNYQATIVSGTTSSINVNIPNTLSEIKSNVYYKVAPFTVETADTFRLLSPEILSFSPNSGPTGTLVRIYGKNFTSSRPVVKFGDIAVSPSYYTTSYVEVMVPALSNGLYKISVICNTIPAISKTDFYVSNPKIKSFYPLSATFNDEILIKGECLTRQYSNTSVIIGNQYATIKTLTDTSIIALVPLGCDSIPRKISVQIGYTNADSEKEFVLTPPQFLSYQPSLFSVGDEITIYGTGFCPGSTTYNKLYIDSYPLTIISSTATEIKARAPNSLPRGNFRLVLITGGYKRSLPLNFEFNSQWLKIPIPTSINWSPATGVNTSGIAFSVKGKGYMMDYINSRMISFNPATNDFIDLGIFTKYRAQQGLKPVVHNDKLYLIGGTIFDSYNTESNTWVSQSPPPLNLKNGVGFSLAGKLFFGLQYDVNAIGPPSKFFWTYDEISNTWTEKAIFPNLSTKIAVTYFAMGNNGYVLFLDNKFCKYNADTDTWSLLATYPGSSKEMFGSVSFVLNNKIYVGSGKTFNYPSIVYDDFWSYDPISDIWSKISVIPGGGRFNSISFVINNKAYLGFGYNQSGNLQNDFYEFDPNFPMK